MAPMELSDYEKIHQDINRAVERIQASLDHQDRMIEKLMPREEYEKRHTIIEQGITNNQTANVATNNRINDFGKWALDQHDRLRQLMTDQADKFILEIENLRKEITAMKDDTSSNRRDIIWRILGYIIPFLLGLGAAYLLRR